MVAPVPAKPKAPVKKAFAPKQAARVVPKQPPKKERCARCGTSISSRRTPCVWHEHIVCEHCHSRLRAYEPAMAICPGAKPVLRYARGAAESRPRGITRWMGSVGRKFVSIF